MMAVQRKKEMEVERHSMGTQKDRMRSSDTERSQITCKGATMWRTADLSTNDGSQTTAENYLQGMMRVTVASKLCPWENFQERGQNRAYLQISKN